MRVLLDVSAVPARPVGAGVYTIAIARGISARDDVDVHLLTRRDDTARWAELAPTAELHALAPKYRPVRLAWEQAAGPRVARRIRPDVWHGPHYTMPLRSTVPTVVAMHDLTFFDHPEWHERSKVIYFRRMIAAAARRADVILTGSNDAAEGLRARFRLQGEIVVVHHGVDNLRFSPTGDDAADGAALAKHGITSPYVAFASTIEPRKDVPTLVRAFARVSRRRTPTSSSSSPAVTGGVWRRRAPRSRRAASRRASCVPATSTTPHWPPSSGGPRSSRIRRSSRASACRRSRRSRAAPRS